MMKTIVMYTDFRYGKQNSTGGTQRYLELIYGLIAMGNDVHLFIPKDAELRNDKHLIRHDIRSCEINSSLIPNGLLNILVNCRNIFSIRRIKYDALITFDIPITIQFWLLRLKKIFLFIRQDFIGCREISIGSKNLIKKFYLIGLTILEKAVLLHAYKIIVQCQYDKDSLLKRHRSMQSLIEAKMFILNNNVNPSWVKDKSYIRRKEKLHPDTRLAFVGGVSDQRKGLSILLDAVTILLDEGENIVLHVIGGGQLLDHYKNIPNIKFWGRLEDPLKVTKECDLMVVPSIADSFPNTITEAFYLELPVIGSNVGGIPEMLKYEDLIFPPNVTDLVKKLRDIIHNEKFELYREYARTRKKELTFDWVAKICEYLELKSGAA